MSSITNNWFLLIPFFCALQVSAQAVSGLEAQDKNRISRIGIIADCQYADQPTQGSRHYQLSNSKLSQCVTNLNTLDLDHVFHLGDLIDQHWESFEVVMPIIKGLKAPVTLVLGNHDFSVNDQFKEKVPHHMGLKKRYFSVRINTWKFIILDGNDISLYAWPAGSENYIESARIYEEGYLDHEVWNGAVGDTQLAWLERELKQSEASSEKVILLCHFPILPIDNHVLWNAGAVLDTIKGYSCVKAWFNGHNHSGGYAESHDKHFVTFKGMVDTDTTSYAIVELDDKRMVIKGFGREKDLNLAFD